MPVNATTRGRRSTTPRTTAPPRSSPGSATPTCTSSGASCRRPHRQGGRPELCLRRARRADRPRRSRPGDRGASSTPTAGSHPMRPRMFPAHFADPTVGGVQSLVRIYNRQSILTWFQDVEFGVYGHLYQAGRNDWGTAGMGGNGQFNRLSALDDVADADRPLARPPDRGSGPRPAAGRRRAGAAARSCAPPSTSRDCRSCVRCCASARAGRRATCRRCGWSGSLIHAPFTEGARLELLGLPVHAAVAGNHRSGVSHRRRPDAVSTSRRSGTAAPPGSCSSSTCLPSAARSWAGSPPADPTVRGDGRWGF